MIDLSIRLEDFAPSKLICLAENLDRRYGGRSIQAFLFSTREAARYSIPVTVDPSPAQLRYRFAFHGYYSHNRETGEQFLQIMPSVHGQEHGSPFLTQIDLPANGAPVCRLAIDNRCLLEFHDLGKPSTQEAPNPSGAITIGATIGRNGKVSNLKVTGAAVASEKDRPVLAEAALANLRTWRFEPVARTSPIRITYRFRISNTPPTANDRWMRFKLPEEVSLTSFRSKL